MQMKKVVAQVKKVPEAVKEEFQVEVKLELSVRNGKGGHIAARWVVLNQVEIDVAELKLATQPVLMMAAQRAVPMTVEGFLKGHGEAVVRQLQALQIRAVQAGLVEVIENPPDVGEEEERQIIIAKE